MKRMLPFALILSVLLLFFWDSEAQTRKSTWVRPYTTRSGKYVSGHARKGYSTSPHAYKRRAYNRAYYQRNKWRYKSRRR
jgi:hypothetical protein